MNLISYISKGSAHRNGLVIKLACRSVAEPKLPTSRNLEKSRFSKKSTVFGCLTASVVPELAQS